MITVAELAARAEVVWRTASGDLFATPIIPLVIDGQVVAALPFSQTPDARRLAEATTAVVVFSDSRMAWKGWTPCSVPVNVEVTVDRAGDWTWTGALDQEVRKHPPARLLMDTAIQRREHWWYVPRWIVRLHPRGPSTAIARRAAPDDGVLVTPTAPGGSPGLTAHSVAVDDWHGDAVVVTPLDTATMWDATTAHEALLCTHDFAIPDQERTSMFEVAGTLEDRCLRVTERRGQPDLPSTRLAHRIRRHFRLERACRRALAVYDASPPDTAT
ncbi:hypothetical protein BH23ACT10_BH23ACT10_39840 [soil metagenome]